MIGAGGALFFFTGFSCNEYRPLWLECCYCPFMTCLIVAVSTGAGWAMEGWGGINSRIPSSFFFLSGDKGCSTIASTFCTTSLLLSLSSTSKRTLPLRLECSLWAAQYRSLLDPSLLGHVLGALVNTRLQLQLPSLSSPLHTSPAFYDLPTFRCLSAWISQMCVCCMGNALLNYSCPTWNFRERLRSFLMLAWCWCPFFKSEIYF